MIHWSRSVIRSARQQLLRYQRAVVAFLLALVLAINLSPSAASALEWFDLIRVIPSVIQVVQIANLSDNDEVTLGRNIDRQVKSQIRISRDPAANALVNRIGQMLVPVSDRPNIPYTFQVIEDNDINAFATMGGFVYINTGTIMAADNVAQLAGVIGHEMGHIAGRHALEQVKQAAIAQGLATVAGVGDDRLVQLATTVAFSLPNSREAEYDADRRGLSSIVKAGFAARAMPDFMQKLGRQSGGVPSFLSTHPAAGERVSALNQVIQEQNLHGGGGLNDGEYQRIWRNRYGSRRGY